MTLRRELHGVEQYPFLIWWVFSIDTHSILTGSGAGDFVGTVVRIRTFLAKLALFLGIWNMSAYLESSPLPIDSLTTEAYLSVESTDSHLDDSWLAMCSLL